MELQSLSSENCLLKMATNTPRTYRFLDVYLKFWHHILTSAQFPLRYSRLFQFKTKKNLWIELSITHFFDNILKNPNIP